MKQLLNVNSLTDIVSNSVGILIIFAVLNIAHESGKTHQIDVPLEHETEHIPAFFIVKDNAMIYLDPDIFFDAMRHVNQEKDEFDFGGDLRLRAKKTTEWWNFVIHATDTVHWHDISELDNPDSQLCKTLGDLDKAKQYAYFFVYDTPDPKTAEGSGYGMFRRARHYLKQKGIKSGWRPVDTENPPYFCFWDSEAICKNYKPLYRSDTGE